jgi:hypothetical protein
VLPALRDRLSKADAIIAARAKPLNDAKWKTLLKGVHPDSHVDARTEAFRLLMEMEALLHDTERPRLDTGMPKTVHGLIASKVVKAGPPMEASPIILNPKAVMDDLHKIIAKRNDEIRRLKAEIASLKKRLAATEPAKP